MFLPAQPHNNTLLVNYLNAHLFGLRVKLLPVTTSLTI